MLAFLFNVTKKGKENKTMIITFNRKDILEIIDPHPEVKNCIAVLTNNASYTFRNPVAVCIDNDTVMIDTDGY